MKKEVIVLQSMCDFCGKQSYQKCLGCGKDVCWECQKTEGIDFKHAVHFSGSGDGFYCQSCLSDPKVIETPLLKAYKKIWSLRKESEIWWKEFDERTKAAEIKLQLLREMK